jgi:hypothetical protein
MCFIPRNFHVNGAMYNATVYLKDGSHKKWSISRLDAGRLNKLWRFRIFNDVEFNGLSLSLVEKINLRSRFSADDDFCLC